MVSDRLHIRSVGPGPVPDHLKAEIAKATVIVADNVRDVLLSDPDRLWTPEDFPNVAPPYQTIFVESSSALRGGQDFVGADVGPSSGVLIRSFRLDNWKELEAAQPFVPRALQGRPLPGKWLCVADVIQGATRLPLWEGTVRWFVDAAGSVVPRTDAESARREWPEELDKWFYWRRWYWVDPSPQYRDLMRAAGSFRGIDDPALGNRLLVERAIATDADLALLTITFMHAHEIEVREVVERAPRQARRLAEREGQPPPPDVRYYVLDLERIRRVLKDEGKSDEVGPKRAMRSHAVRAHFKDYRHKASCVDRHTGKCKGCGKGLFGRVRRVIFFDYGEEPSRGDPGVGRVEKDYRPADPDPGSLRREWGLGDVKENPREDRERRRARSAARGEWSVRVTDALEREARGDLDDVRQDVLDGAAKCIWVEDWARSRIPEEGDGLLWYVWGDGEPESPLARAALRGGTTTGSAVTNKADWPQDAEAADPEWVVLVDASESRMSHEADIDDHVVGWKEAPGSALGWKPTHWIFVDHPDADETWWTLVMLEDGADASGVRRAWTLEEWQAGAESTDWVTDHGEWIGDDWVSRMAGALSGLAEINVGDAIDSMRTMGVDLMDAAPERPRQADQAAEEFVAAIEKANGISINALYALAAETPGEHRERPDPRLFGHYLVMMGMGHGVGWFDDHPKFPLAVPGIEVVDLTWSISDGA